MNSVGPPNNQIFSVEHIEVSWMDAVKNKLDHGETQSMMD